MSALEKTKELMRGMTQAELETLVEHAAVLIEQIEFENEDTNLDDDGDDFGSDPDDEEDE